MVKLLGTFLFFLLFIEKANSEENDITSKYLKRILVDDNFYTLLNRLNALEKKVNELESNSTDKTVIQALQQDVASIKAQQTKQNMNVAFMAYLTTDVWGVGHHIYFNDVKTNVGNAYNPHHGMFVAPVHGLYQFTITACSYTGHYIVLDLFVNDDSIDKLLAGSRDDSDCNSNVWVVELKARDDVYVKHTSIGDLLKAEPTFSLPSFTGVFLKSVE